MHIKNNKLLICACGHAKSLQSGPTLCDLTDCSTPGSSVHGILQGRMLEWVAMPSSNGSSQPRDWTCISYVCCICRQVIYHYGNQFQYSCLGNPMDRGAWEAAVHGIPKSWTTSLSIWEAPANAYHMLISGWRQNCMRLSNKDRIWFRSQCQLIMT